MKHLSEKFSLTRLQEVSKRKGWIIPTSEQVRKESFIKYRIIWVADEPVDDYDNTRGVCMNTETGNTFQAHKDNMYHSIVIKKKKSKLECLLCLFK